jgi:3-methyl-2-oxobutanoate hydroxymethyltransferase
VFHDLLGIQTEVAPKFVKRYAQLNDVMIEALKRYGAEVRSGAYPDLEHSYGQAEPRPRGHGHDD